MINLDLLNLLNNIYVEIDHAGFKYCVPIVSFVLRDSNVTGLEQLKDDIRPLQQKYAGSGLDVDFVKDKSQQYIPHSGGRYSLSQWQDCMRSMQQNWQYIGD